MGSQTKDKLLTVRSSQSLTVLELRAPEIIMVALSKVLHQVVDLSSVVAGQVLLDVYPPVMQVCMLIGETEHSSRHIPITFAMKYFRMI